MSKARRCNPTLGTSTLPMGVGGDQGTFWGAEGACLLGVSCRQLAPATGGAAGLSRMHWGAWGLVIPPPG